MNIMFSGIVTRNKITHIRFAIQNGDYVEVPIDQLTADRISKYLSRFSPPTPQAERLNDEDAEI